MERSRGWQKFKSGMKRAYQRYDRMMEKQGFYVVLAICVLVIGLSAFYTFRLRSEEEEPVLTSGEAESADSSQAQTLSEAKELVTGGDLEKYDDCEVALDIISMTTNVMFTIRDRAIIVQMK